MPNEQMQQEAPQAAAIAEEKLATGTVAATMQTIAPEFRALMEKSVTGVYDYMPKDLEQALKLADVLSNSDMVPKNYINKPGNVMVAIQWGAELGLKPLQSMQSIAVINGKPGLYGDVGKALLLTHGCQIIEWDARRIEAEGYAECTIIRPHRPPVTRTFSMEDAKRAGLARKDGPWTTYPFRQLAWRAFWFAARDAASDILRGMQGAEELADLPAKDVAAEGSTERAPRVAQPTAKNGEAKPKDDEAAKTPASDGMKKHIEKRMAAAEVGIETLCAKFPDVKLTFEGLTVAQANAILEWLTNGAKA